MKTENIKRSLLILSSLVILSYGFLISAQEGFNSTANVFSNQTDSSNSAGTAATENDSKNLTTQVAKKLSEVATSSDPNNQQISVDQLQKIIDDSLNQGFSSSDLPTVSPDEIKIKKQDYTGTSDQIKAKKKEDFTNYIVAVYYILASSSPKPITNNADLNSLSTYVLQTVTTALNNRSTSGLAEISQSGRKILDQLKDVTVPEDLVDLHTRALQFAKYAIKLEPNINANTQDPLADLVNISKMESFVEALMSFSQQVNAKFSEYGLTYDDAIKGKLESLGITPPQLDTSSKTKILPLDGNDTTTP